jgi:hypothetical protein
VVELGGSGVRGWWTKGVVEGGGGAVICSDLLHHRSVCLEGFRV